MLLIVNNEQYNIDFSQISHWAPLVDFLFVFHLKIELFQDEEQKTHNGRDYMGIMGLFYIRGLWKCNRILDL